MIEKSARIDRMVWFFGLLYFLSDPRGVLLFGVGEERERERVSETFSSENGSASRATGSTLKKEIKK